MSNLPTITITGGLGSDPELRTTPSGQSVANLSVAVQDRVKNGAGEWVDGETVWYKCAVWRDYAEHVAESLHKGDRVIVTGRLKPRSYEKDGVKQLSLDVEVDEIGPALRFSTAVVSKAGQGGSRQQPKSQVANDPWGQSQPDPWAAPAPTDAPPF